MSPILQLCSFRLLNAFLGMDVQKIQEVLPYQEMTPVPLAPKGVRGLINLRGKIVTAIDLRTMLDLPPHAPDARPMNIVIQAQGGAVSLLVDSIGDVIEVAPEDLEATPETVDPRMRSLIIGTHKLPRELLIVLDVERILALEAEVVG
jgi:purine-binding chemotaxis protein CheW